MEQLKPTALTDFKSATFMTPDFIEIKKNAHGFYGSFTKKAFKKDEKMYTNICLEFPAETFVHKKFDYLVNGEKFEFDSKVHASFSDNCIYQYGWDSYLNHSCDQSIYYKEQVKDAEGRIFYDAFAKKDIEAGEELNSNYNDFYESLFYPFDCFCGSSNCCNKVRGYKPQVIDI